MISSDQPGQCYSTSILKSGEFQWQTAAGTYPNAINDEFYVQSNHTFRFGWNKLELYSDLNFQSDMRQYLNEMSIGLRKQWHKKEDNPFKSTVLASVRYNQFYNGSDRPMRLRISSTNGYSFTKKMGMQSTVEFETDVNYITFYKAVFGLNYSLNSKISIFAESFAESRPLSRIAIRTTKPVIQISTGGAWKPKPYTQWDCYGIYSLNQNEVSGIFIGYSRLFAP